MRCLFLTFYTLCCAAHKDYEENMSDNDDDDYESYVPVDGKRNGTLNEVRNSLHYFIATNFLVYFHELGFFLFSG